jgi:hypothetical protein
MMEAASTSETPENFYQTTRRYNPEDSHVHTRRHEKLKPHQVRLCFPYFNMYFRFQTDNDDGFITYQRVLSSSQSKCSALR